MTAVKKLQREKKGGGGGLLNFMRLFSLSQIAKCRGISQELNSSRLYPSKKRKIRHRVFMSFMP